MTELSHKITERKEEKKKNTKRTHTHTEAGGRKKVVIDATHRDYILPSLCCHTVAGYFMLMCLFLKHSKYNLPSFCFPFLPLNRNDLKNRYREWSLRFFLFRLSFSFAIFLGPHCSLVLYIAWYVCFHFVYLIASIRTVRNLKISVHLNGNTLFNSNTKNLHRSIHIPYW